MDIGDSQSDDKEYRLVMTNYKLSVWSCDYIHVY